MTTAPAPTTSRRRSLRRTTCVAVVGMIGSLTLTGCSHTTKASPSATTSASHATAAPSGRTSCTSVVYIGESTSVGMVSAQQIPAPTERLEARLKAVGVTRLSVNVSGGRSAIERLMGRPNTLDVIPPTFTRTYRGCYVIAEGVNDAANATMPGSAATDRARIDLVMQRIGNRPTLWPLVTTSSTLTGPYANAHMAAFDAELRAATTRYPNLRLYDWPAEMNPAWTEPDGIHDRRIGSRERALMTAHALAAAFPAGRGPVARAVTGSVWGRPPSAANRPTLPAAPEDDGVFWAADTTALTLYTSGLPTN